LEAKWGSGFYKLARWAVRTDSVPEHGAIHITHCARTVTSKKHECCELERLSHLSYLVGPLVAVLDFLVRELCVTNSCRD